jgi:hypothetical protein
MLRKRTARPVVDPGHSGNVFLLQLVQMRSEACTPSGAVVTWRSNVGPKAAEVSSMLLPRGTVQLGVMCCPAESVTVLVAPLGRPIVVYDNEIKIFDRKW